MLADVIAATRLAEMAALGSAMAGDVRVDELPRLSAVVAHEQGRQAPSLRFSVGFRMGAEGFPVVHISVQGILSLTCQRCLGPVDWPVDIDVSLTALGDDARSADLAEPFDSVALDQDGALPLRAVVEDEILAALPMVPSHPDEARCGGLATVPARAKDNGSPAANRPFAGLGSMLRGTRGSES